MSSKYFLINLCEASEVFASYHQLSFSNENYHMMLAIFLPIDFKIEKFNYVVILRKCDFRHNNRTQMIIKMYQTI